MAKLGSSLLSGLAQASVAASKPAKKRKPAPARKRKPAALPPAFQPITTAKPIQSLRAPAKKKVQAAERRIPARPVPAVPYIIHPTKQQQRAATKAVVKARKSGGLTADLHSVDRQDPAQQALAKAAAHYGRVTHNNTLAMIGRQVAVKSGVTRPLTRGQAVAVGQSAVAEKIKRDGEIKKRVLPTHKVSIPGLGGLATVDLAPLEKDAAGFIDKHTSLNQGDGATRIVKNLVSDVAQLGEGVPLGLLQLGQAGQRAVFHGDLEPAKELGSAVAHAAGKDPIVQAVGATLGVKGASYKGALESLKEHPGFALLDADAGIGIAGRGVGAISRGLGSTAESAGIRGSLARLGDTVRAPVGLTDEASLAKKGYVKERRYSKNVVHKSFQKARDDRRDRVLDAEGKPVLIEQRGRQVEVVKPKGGGHKATIAGRELSRNEARKLQQQRADFLASQGHSIEVGQRHIADAELREATHGFGGLKGHTAQQVAALLATGTVRSAKTLKGDLITRAKQIEHELETPGNYATRREVRSAKAQAAFLRRAADDPKVLEQAAEIERVGLAHAKNLNSDEGKSIGLNLIEKARAHRARLSEYALAHMNARHHSEDEHAALEREAFKEEHAARAARDAAPAHLRDQAAREYELARDRRIAVSGREPGQVRLHEKLRDEHAAQVDVVKTARGRLKRAQRRVDDLAAVHRSKRMQGSQPGARKSHDHEKREMEKRTAVRDREAERVKAAVDALYRSKTELDKVPMPEINAGLRHFDGTYLDNKQIEEHARDHGARDPDTIAYLPHVEGGVGARAFHKQLRPGTRPTTSENVRTGSLYKRGGNAFGTELVREEMTHKKTAVAKAELLDKQVSEAGLLHPHFEELRDRARAQQLAKENARARGEQYVVPAGERLTREERSIIRGEGRLTGKEGLELARRLADEGQDFIAVREFSTKLSSELQQGVKSLHDPAAMATAHLKLLSDRIVGPEDKTGARNVVLYPLHEYNRMIEHLTPASSLEKSVQLLNGPFRMAVLPQPRWLFGNFIEPYLIRLPLSGAGLNLIGAGLDIAATSKLLKRLERSGDPASVAQAKAIRAQLGGLFVGRRGAAVRRTYEDFPEGKARAAFYVAHVIRNAPVTKQLGDLLLAIPKTFFAVNRVIESGAQRQALGKSIRADIHEFQGSWTKTLTMTDDVMAQVQKGALKTSTLHRWMKEQHDLLGKYEGFDPRTRRLIQTFMPFLPWSLAAARFVWMTMPLHHTAATAFLLKASQANQDQFADLHKDVPPGALKAAIVRKDGGLVDVARYTPWGFSVPLVEGDYKGVTDTFLPQLSGVIKALQGKDPFGRDLIVKPSKDNPKGQATNAQQLEIAGYTGFEAMVPLLAMARRLTEGGGTPYADSRLGAPKTKPGSSHMSAVERTLSPVRPVYLKKKKGGGGGTSLPGWGSSGSSSSRSTSAPGWGG